MVPKHNAATWGLTLNSYNSDTFGRALNQFKVPASTYKIFRKKVITPNPAYSTTMPIDENNQPTFSSEAFDVEKVFENMCFTYINTIASMYQIVRETEFFEFEQDTREALRNAVYLAIEYACQNRQIWQNVNGSAISVPGYSMGADQTPWVISADMLGMKATNVLTNSGLEEYEWQFTEGTFTNTLNGNIKILVLDKEDI